MSNQTENLGLDIYNEQRKAEVYGVSKTFSSRSVKIIMKKH